MKDHDYVGDAMAGAPVLDVAASLRDDRRLHQRHPIRWPMDLIRRLPDGAVSYRGRTLDLSISGARIATDGHCKVGETVACRLTVLPRGGHARVGTIELVAVVVHSTYSSTAVGFETGLNFEQFVGNGKNLLADAFIAFEKDIPAKSLKVIRWRE